jgi:hypothetical protein
MYKRERGDEYVVPYNKDLLILWNGHINIQYITQRGIEQYLVKYISKIEPTLLAKSTNSSNSNKFQYMRVVSSIEAAALISGHHFVQSSFKVTYLNIPFEKEQFKFLAIVY